MHLMASAAVQCDGVRQGKGGIESYIRHLVVYSLGLTCASVQQKDCFASLASNNNVTIQKCP